MVKEIKDLQRKTEDQGFPGSGKKENAGSSKGKESGGRAIPDRLADGLSWFMILVCVGIFGIMVFSVSYGVLGRYLPFVKNPRWTQELAILCMVWLCFLGAGYAIKEGLHVRMTLISFLVPKKLASVLHGCAYGLLLVINLMWVIYGIQLLQLTKMAKMAATGWPMSVTYFSVVAGGVYGMAMALYRLWKGGF